MPPHAQFLEPSLRYRKASTCPISGTKATVQEGLHVPNSGTKSTVQEDLHIHEEHVAAAHWFLLREEKLFLEAGCSLSLAG